MESLKIQLICQNLVKEKKGACYWLLKTKSRHFSRKHIPKEQNVEFDSDVY